MLAVITGASRGIGESYARQLAARGYALLLVARDAERLARVAGEIRAAHAVAVEEIVLDLAQAARKYGVLIQTCCPGRTATDFHATAGVKSYWAPGDQQTADEVVSESLAALDRGRDFVVTGWRNRLLTRV